MSIVDELGAKDKRELRGFLKRAIDWLILATIFLPPLVFSMRMTTYGITKLVVAEILIFTLGILWLLKVNEDGRFVFRDTLLTIPVGLFFLVNLVSLTKAESLPASINALIALFFWVLFFLICLHNLQDRERMRSLCLAFIIPAFLASIFGILQSTAGGLLSHIYKIFLSKGYILAVLCERGAKSTFGNTNFAADCMVIAIPISIALFLTARNLLTRAVYGIILLTDITYVVLAKCRSSWVGFIASLAFILGAVFLLARRSHLEDSVWQRIRQWTKKLLIIVVLLLVIAPSFAIVSGRGRFFVRRFTSIFDVNHPTNRFRILTWGSTWRIFRDNPLLGVGIDNFKIVYPEYREPEEWKISGQGSRVDHAHNDYLQMAAETGVLGIVSFLGIIVVLFLSFGKLVFKIKDAEDSCILVGFGASLVGLLIHALFAFPFCNPTSCVSFWALAAIIMNGEYLFGRS